MAIGRPSRSGKRSSSSSSSYTTTITTVLFLTLCVLALWMLTSPSLQGPTHTAILARKAATSMAASTGAVADVVLDQSHTFETTSTAGKNKQSVFEDNPGDLPADAIKSDENNNNNQASAAEEKDKHTQISEESTMTTAQSVNQQVIVEETTSKNNDNSEKDIELQPVEKSNVDSQQNAETKSFEELQLQQRMEDAGIQNPVDEKPENKVTSGGDGAL